jgi:DNA-binding transcriptional LysR family regulator
VEVRILEHEPQEAVELLARDQVDLALIYDYNLAPAAWRNDHEVSPLWSVAWGLGVPSSSTRRDLADHADQDWIVNSRHTADEEVVRTLASMVGFTPRVTHRIDSLELVDDLVLAGRGVALLPCDRPARPGVTVLPLDDPLVELRAFAVTRVGRSQWAPLRALVERLSS